MPSSPEYQKEWRKRNPDKVKEHNRRHYEKHKGYNSLYRQLNTDYLLALVGYKKWE